MLRHTRLLRYVDEVARQGSIRRAAERLHVAPSAVQRRIADMEVDLGTTLFERTATGMRPTAAGEAFVHWVRRQAAELDRVRSQIEDMQGLQSGTIRIACSQAVAAELLPTEIKAFGARYPDIAFQVSVQSHAAAFTALAAYDVDLALVFRPSAVQGIAVLAMLDQRLVAVMAAGHPLAGRGTVRLRDCAAYPVALLDRSFGSRQITDAALAEGSTRFRIAMESNSFELLRRYVADTDAITFQIESGVSPSPDLARCAVDERDKCGGPLVLAKVDGRTLPVAADAFVRQVMRRLSLA